MSTDRGLQMKCFFCLFFWFKKYKRRLLWNFKSGQNPLAFFFSFKSQSYAFKIHFWTWNPVAGRVKQYMSLASKTIRGRNLFFLSFQRHWTTKRIGLFPIAIYLFSCHLVLKTNSYGECAAHRDIKLQLSIKSCEELLLGKHWGENRGRDCWEWDGIKSCVNVWVRS